MAACACSQPDVLLPPSFLKHHCHVDVDNAQHCQLVKSLQGVRHIITRYRSQKFTTKKTKTKTILRRQSLWLITLLLYDALLKTKTQKTQEILPQQCSTKTMRSNQHLFTTQGHRHVSTYKQPSAKSHLTKTNGKVKEWRLTRLMSCSMRQDNRIGFLSLGSPLKIQRGWGGGGGGEWRVWDGGNKGCVEWKKCSVIFNIVIFLLNLQISFAAPQQKRGRV